MATELSSGVLLDGKYRIQRLVGRGGMGEVYAAVHDALSQRVAVKVLAARLADDDASAARFLREARSIAHVAGNHVVRVLDMGTVAGGRPYMVMELLEGKDLAQHIASEGRLSTERAVDLVLEALEGVAEAHARGIVHRDLKPSNIFLTSSGVKVLDFGIAKAVTQSSDDALTTVGGILGSPAFASPEQLRSARTADVRSDVWSIGAMLYQLVTNELPFQGDSSAEVVAAVLGDDPEPPSAHVPTLSPVLDRVVLRCLSRDIEARYSDVGALASALSDLASSTGKASASRIQETLARETASDDDDEPLPEEDGVRTDAIAPEALGVRTLDTWSDQRDSRTPKRSSRGWMLLPLLVAVAVVLMFAFRRGPTPAEPLPVPASPPPHATAATPSAAVIPKATATATPATPALDPRLAKQKVPAPKSNNPKKNTNEIPKFLGDRY